nr:sigma factor [Labilithrix luteola]
MRRGLLSMLRRRVPAEDAQDLAQTVLCDALAAPAVPADPDELQRWVNGIARNKVSDFHRRGRRLVPDESVQELGGPPPAYEAREILGEVLHSTSPRDRATLDWIVREHAGERLNDIAKEEGLPSPVVRQRISRLRRLLRARWAGALVALVGVASAAGAHRHDVEEFPSIVADTSSAALDLAHVDGTFNIAAVTAASDLPAARRKLLELQAAGATVRVTPGRVEIEGSAGRLVRDVRVIGTSKEGTNIELTSTSGRVVRAVVRGDGDRFVVTILDGSMRGQITLVRP